MMLPIATVLTVSELTLARQWLKNAPWESGKSSAGPQASAVKNNDQLPHTCAEAAELRAIVLRALDRSSIFFNAVLPKRIYTPTFNRYEGEHNHYGVHVDNAIRYAPESGQKIRADVSCTLFLSAPDEYEGGELRIHQTHGAQQIKLQAGHLVVYPAAHVHEVLPVHAGARYACFFWIESMVRNVEQRAMLFELDQSITALRQQYGESDATIKLTGTYHNLLRMWADT